MRLTPKERESCMPCKPCAGFGLLWVVWWKVDVSPASSTLVEAFPGEVSTSLNMPLNTQTDHFSLQ